MQKQAMKAQKAKSNKKSVAPVKKTAKRVAVKATKSQQRRTMSSSADLKQSLSIHDAFVADTQRTYRNWKSKPVSADVIKKAYDTIKFGPTAFNSSPLRIAIVQTPEAKAKFAPSLMEANVQPMQSAPLTAIFCYDSAFNTHFDYLSPGYDGGAKYFEANPGLVNPTASLNATLQAGYMIAALRTQGLDLGPANGFSTEKCDADLFQGNEKTKTWKSFMYVNIGHANPEGTFPRSPRFDFDTASQQI